MIEARKIELALNVAFQYAQIDGVWVIDQMVRTLTEERYAEWYAEWVRAVCDGDDGDMTYEWDSGIEP